MNQLFLSGFTLNDLLERFEQIIDQKIRDFQPTQNKAEQTEFITRQEVAELLKITLPTLHEWTKLGWLQSYKLGNRVLYKKQEVEQALHKVGSFKFKKGGLTYGA